MAAPDDGAGDFFSGWGVLSFAGAGAGAVGSASFDFVSACSVCAGLVSSLDGFGFSDSAQQLTFRI